MDEILELTSSLRIKAKKYGDEITTLVGGLPEDLPSGVFGMIFNNLTLQLELLSYYNDEWSVNRSTKAPSVQEAKKQRTYRVLLIQKMTFISILSMLEFCFKNYILAFPEKIGHCKNSTGKVYLSTILNTSHTMGIISTSELELWDGLIHLRNYLVHNNGVSQETKTYIYPSCELVLTDKQMTQGNLMLFSYLTNWLLDASNKWVKEMHKK